MEDLYIDKRYNRYSLFVVLHLIHNHEEFKNIWIDKFVDQETYANNYFKDENCGCKPKIVSCYKQERFAADCIAVKFINENPDSVNFDNVESDASPDITGNAFSMPATEAHYQDFLASLQQKNAMFNHFVPVTIGDKLIVTFF
tara:strand:+ start:703 stop:1131 length:429 start_codon:yes stop_codon:yes gene_type:complete